MSREFLAKIFESIFVFHAKLFHGYISCFRRLKRLMFDFLYFVDLIKNFLIRSGNAKMGFIPSKDVIEIQRMQLLSCNKG